MQITKEEWEKEEYKEAIELFNQVARDPVKMEILEATLIENGKRYQSEKHIRDYIAKIHKLRKN